MRVILASLLGLLGIVVIAASPQTGAAAQKSVGAPRIAVLATVPGSRLTQEWPPKFDSWTKLERFCKDKGLSLKREGDDALIFDREATGAAPLLRFLDGLKAIERLESVPGSIIFSDLTDSERLGLRELMRGSANFTGYLALEQRKDLRVLVEPTAGIRFSNGSTSVQDLYRPVESQLPPPKFAPAPSKEEMTGAERALADESSRGDPSRGLVFLWTAIAEPSTRLDLVRRALALITEEQATIRANLDASWKRVVDKLWGDMRRPANGEKLDALPDLLKDSIRASAGSQLKLGQDKLDDFLSNGKVTGHRLTFSLTLHMTDARGQRQTCTLAISRP